MKRRNFVKNIALAIGALPLLKLTPSSAAIIPPGGSIPLRLNLSTPGRVGFYVDYSELDTIGTHIFYVCRTHGTEGTVSVGYKTFGDNHSNTAGTLTWGNGEADVKSFTVNVNSKGPGDHRIFAQLTNPTGGVALHHGDHTMAYGVIDDDTIDTANAIFIDANATNNGNGSIVNPYNNWYDARDSVGIETRYIYIKGLIVPNTTDGPTNVGDSYYLGIEDTFKNGRSNETQRIYIRNWPGFIGGIDGGGSTTVSGFRAARCGNYITIRNLTIQNLHNSNGSLSSKGYALRTYSKGEPVDHFTAEKIKVRNIFSGQGAAVAVWYSEGYCKGIKMWRWDIDDVTRSKPKPLTAFEAYAAASVSIQRCTFGETCGGVYEKETPNTPNEIGYSIRFNHFQNSAVRFSTQGGRPLSNWAIVQSNIFDSPNECAIRTDCNGESSASQKRWIVGNIIHNWNHGTLPGFWVNHSSMVDTIQFHNIFSEVQTAYRYDHPSTTLPEYSDYNHYYRPGLDTEFLFEGETRYSLSTLQNVKGFDKNSLEGDPLFVNRSANNWKLAENSPAKGTGLNQSDKGPHLVGHEIIGAAGTMTASNPTTQTAPPSKTTLSVQVLQ